MTTTERASARERLLAAANELFYDEGIHTVGIDRVIERAGVAKASLYNTFGSKDELVRSYLHERHEARRRRIEGKLAAAATPRARLLAVYDALAEAFADPGFHGCAFVNASAEARPGSPVTAVVDEYRDWVRSLFVELARDAGAPNPEQLGARLVLLYDGASIAARMDNRLDAAATARATAEILLDAALAS